MEEVDKGAVDGLIRRVEEGDADDLRPFLPTNFLGEGILHTRLNSETVVVDKEYCKGLNFNTPSS